MLMDPRERWTTAIIMVLIFLAVVVVIAIPMKLLGL